MTGLVVVATEVVVVVVVEVGPEKEKIDVKLMLLSFRKFHITG